MSIPEGSTNVGGIHSTLSLDSKNFEESMKRVDKYLAQVDKNTAQFEKTLQELEQSSGDTAKGVNDLGGAFGDMFKSVVAGELTAHLLEKAFDGALEKAKELVKWLPEIAIEGAGVADVTENFNNLTKAVGQTGSTLLGALREGTHNTITDFELMKTVNSNLAAGMVLTDTKLRTLAEGAFALAQATGKDVATSFDTMNNAMLRGQTRAVAMLTGKINLQEAEEKYRVSINKLSGSLTEEQRLESTRMAILDAVGKATQRLGEQTDGLDEFVAQAQTAWKNFQEELGVSLAQNPKIIALFEGIRDAILNAFGANQATLVENVSEAVGNMAEHVPDVIDYLGQLALSAAKVFDGMVRQAGGVGVALKRIAVGSAAGATFGAVGGGIGAIPGALIGGTVGAFLPVGGGADTGPTQGLKAMEAAIVKLNEGTAIMRKRMAEAKTETDQVVGPMQNLGAAVTTTGAAVTKLTEEQRKAIESATDAGIKKAESYWEEYAKFVTEHSLTGLAQQEELLQQWYQKEVTALDRSKKLNKNYFNELTALNELYRQKVDTTIKESVDKLNQSVAAPLTAKALVNPIGKPEELPWLPSKDLKTQYLLVGTAAGEAEKKITAAMNAAARAAIPVSASNQKLIKEWHQWGGTAEEIATTLGLSLEQVNKVLGGTSSKLTNTLDHWAASLAQLAQVSGGSFGTFMQELSQVVVAWDQASKAADDYKAATNAAGKALALAQGAAAVAGVTGTGSTAKRALGGALSGGQMGAAVGGPIGAVVGAAAGGLLGLFRGLKANGEAAVNPLRQQFVDAAGGLDELARKAQKAGVDIRTLLDAKNPKAYQKAIEDLNKAMQFQDTAMAALDETMSKYGITLAQMGPAAQARMIDKEAAGLFKDLSVLAASGMTTTMMLANDNITKSLNQLAADAMTTGQAIPMAMKPYFQAMLDAGKLTDAAGKKLTDLSGLTFTESVTDYFKDMTTAVKDLVSAIERAFGLARTVPTIPNNNPQPSGSSNTPDPNDPYIPKAGFAGGTPGTAFMDFGKGTDVTLHGREAVLTEKQGASIVQMIQDALAAGAGGGAATPVTLVLDGEVVGNVMIKRTSPGGSHWPQFKVNVGRAKL